MEEFYKFFNTIDDLDNFEKFFKRNCGMIPNANRRKKRFNPLIDLSKEQFEFKYRFSKENMNKLLEMLRDDLEFESLPNSNNQVPVELQIMIAIRYWGFSEHPDFILHDHGISYRTLLKICKKVAAALSSKASRYIRMPATLLEKERVTSGFQILAGMPQIIGAVMHITVRLGPSETFSDNFMHIQIVSDATLRIRDLDCRIQRSSSRQTNKNFPFAMFMQSRIKERFEQNEFRGRVLLGEEDLLCTSYLFTPVTCPSTASEEAFNRAHDLTFASAKYCLRLLRQRFGILNFEICASSNTSKHTVVALALLHNMAIEWNDRSLDNLNKLPETAATSSSNSDDNIARLEFIKNNF